MCSRSQLRRRLSCQVLCLAVAALLPDEPAEAEPNTAPSSLEIPSVVVSFPRCEADAFPLSVFLDSLRVELAGRELHCCTLAEPGDLTYSKAALRVNLTQLRPCGTELEQVRISAQKPDESRAIDRELSLNDVEPSARPRALALAVAELIRLLGPDERNESPRLSPVPPPSEFSTPKQPQPEPTPQAATHTVALGYSVHVEADGRRFPMRQTTSWGGRARLVAVRHSFHADLDLGANYSDARVELGDVVLKSASIGVGFGPRYATRIVIIDLGLRAELGWAWVHGKAAFPDVQAGTGSGIHSSAGLRVSVEGPTAKKVRSGIALESGAVLRSINGDVGVQSATGIAGYYLVAAIGIGVSL